MNLVGNLSISRSISFSLRYGIFFVVVFFLALGHGWRGDGEANAAPPTTVRLNSITVAPASGSVVLGLTKQFSATGLYSDGSMKDLTSVATWSSTSMAVATITAGGLATGSLVGTTTIKAKSGKTLGTTSLTVTAPALLSIAVTPGNAYVVAGFTKQFTATGIFNNGTRQDMTTSVTWGSSAPANATINSGGLSTGQAVGPTTITAVSAAIVGPSTLTVTALPASLALFAGNMGGSAGNVDGTGTAARFNLPNGVATDSVGNVYIADTSNHTIRKVTPSGVVTTLAGMAGGGNTDGTGVAAGFNTPKGIAADSTGNVYVADTFNHMIRKITPTGVVTTLAGSVASSGSSDGIGAAASFYQPGAIAATVSGGGKVTLYVADTYNHTIRKITSTGDVTTLAGLAGFPGDTNDTGAAARFYHPAGIATDSAGNIYVADTFNYTIRKITPSGVVTTLAGLAGTTGYIDATGVAARFYNPVGLATDGFGNVYVGDFYNQTIRKITPTGDVTTLAGWPTVFGSADGTGAIARFNSPRGVATATDIAGNITVYVADTFNQTIRRITSIGEVTTLAGSPSATGSTDATGALARFNDPNGVAADSAGNLYVADTNNQTIRKFTPTGDVTALAGTAGIAGSTNATGAAARFYYPTDVATDSTGNVYVADTSNHTIRKITPAGIVTTLAGLTGVSGSTEGTGAARFYYPSGVATDSTGNVYVADSGNSTIRKITPAGDVTTLAGLAGVSGSAGGTGTTTARFYYPTDVATDSTGNVYVSDNGNHTIRKITPSGDVTTLAGTVGISGSSDGVGTTARFYYPSDLATDSAGNVYVADSYNYTVRKITASGGVTTIAGTAGHIGFTPGELPGVLSFSSGVCVIGTSLYITMPNGVAVLQNLP